VFEGISPDSEWPEELRAIQGGRLHREKTSGAPVLPLEGRTFEEWMASKSKHFRQEAARQRRRLEERGATIRMAETREELARGLRAFGELHLARWRGRGGSKVLTPAVEHMLADAAPKMLDGGRFRLWITEAEERIVSADIFVAAGGEVAGWLGGFDESWGSASPSVQATLAAIRDAFERRDRRVDLGGGEHDYKRRWAEFDDLLQWCTVLPSGPRRPLTRLRLAPRRAYRAAANRIPAQTRRRLDRTIRKLTGRR
jgi:CelD/BcsL family acetyltransferase involved in cellulose biosynthesis